MADKRLNILEGIEKGISQSYLGNFNKIVNLDIDGVPGAVIPQWKLQVQQPFVTDQSLEGFTFTVDTSTDEVIGSGTGYLYNNYLRGQSVRLTTTDTLPAGLATGTTYYVHRSASPSKIKLASSIKNLDDGTYIDITDSGTGTHTITAEVMQDVVQFLDIGNDRYFAITSDEKLWFNSEVGSNRVWMRVTGHAKDDFKGLAFWKNYLFAMHSDDIDILGPIAFTNKTLDSATWDNGKLAFEAGAYYKPSLIMSNDVLYIGDGKYIATLEENAGETFDPDNGATFTWSNNALDLPDGEIVRSLEQLGSSLMIGTSGTGIGKIYTWDTVSPSFEEPLKTSLTEVTTTIVVDNVMYFVDNYWGSLFATNGVTMQKIKDIPKSSLGIQQYMYSTPITMQTYGNSIMSFQDKIIWGVGGTYSPGLYSYNLKTGALNKEYTPGGEYSGTSLATYYYALLKVTATDFWASVWDPTYSGNYRYTQQRLNAMASPNTQNNYYKYTTSFFETGLMTVGTKSSPRTFEFFEIELGKELASGEIITLYYRTNLTDSWTTIGTMSYTSDGAIASKIIQNSVVQADQIQFKVTITTTGSAMSGPELTAIYIS